MNDIKLIDVLKLVFFTILIIQIVYIGEHLTPDVKKYFFVFTALFAAILTLLNPERGLFLLIIAMLYSPEISFGRVGRREIVLRYDDVMLVIGVIGWFIIRIIKKEVKFLIPTGLDKPILFFVFICALSTARGVLINQVEFPLAGFLYILKLSEYFMVCYLVINTIQSKQDLKKYLIVFFTCLVIVCYLGIQQIQRGAFRITSPFESVPEPNTLGGYLIFMFAFTLGFAIMGVKIVNRFTIWIISGLTLYAFLFTLSRGSYLAFFPVMLTIFLLCPRKKKLIALILLIASFYSLPYLPEIVRNRVQSTFTGQNEYKLPLLGREDHVVTLDSSSASRIEKYKAVLNYWAEYPIFGLGITGAGFIDSSIVRTIGELGVMGLFGLIWLFSTIFSEVINSYRFSRNRVNKGLCLGYTAGFIGLLVHSTNANTFLIIRIMGPFWFFTGLVLSIPRLYFDEMAVPVNKETEHPEPEPEEKILPAQTSLPIQF